MAGPNGLSFVEVTFLWHWFSEISRFNTFILLLLLSHLYSPSLIILYLFHHHLHHYYHHHHHHPQFPFLPLQPHPWQCFIHHLICMILFNSAHCSDCHGLGNPYGLWVGYVGVGVRVRLYQPFVYPHPWRRLGVTRQNGDGISINSKLWSHPIPPPKKYAVTDGL